MAVTMLVSFALSLGVMLWQRGPRPFIGSGPAPQAAVPVQRAGTDRNPMTASPERSVPRSPPVIDAPQPAGPTSLRTPARPASASTASDSTDPAEMPVQIVFKHRDRLNKFEGRVVNTSGEPLTLDVRVISGSTHYASQTQVSVGAYVQSHFGIDDGLDMQSGDQVTLQSHPFRDQVIKIP